MAAASDGDAERSIFAAAMPLLFVFLWSTGFISAKLALPHAGPFTTLALRFALTFALLLPALIFFHAPWPNSFAETGHIAVAGLLMQGSLACMFYAMSTGMPAAIAALIGGLQPVLTGVLAGPLLGERVTAHQWLGLLLGLGGVVLVLWERLNFAGADPYGITAAFAGLLMMTCGTFYQKAYCAGMRLRSGSAIQFLAVALIMVPLALAAEGGKVDWTPQFLAALGWMVVGLSIGAMMILWLLIRQGAAAKVASLFYLTPPVTAVLAWFAFGERLSMIALMGMAVTALGVALVTMGARLPSQPSEQGLPPE